MLSDVIAERVIRERRRRDWSREQLAKECAKLGASTLTTDALANIETGRRNSDGKRRREITADELAVLARALGIPPILLVFPLGEAERVEVTPGRELPTWQASQWFTGELPFGVDVSDEGMSELAEEDIWAWQRTAAPVHLFREHEQRCKAWASAIGTEDTTAAMDAERRLADIRRTMRQLGLTPPVLRPAHLSELVDGGAP